MKKEKCLKRSTHTTFDIISHSFEFASTFCFAFFAAGLKNYKKARYKRLYRVFITKDYALDLETFSFME